MSHVMVMGECVCCRRMFTFHPNLVPSVRMKDGQLDPGGTREPFCRSCANLINSQRVALGLAPIRIDPQAYEAAVDTSRTW
jgi:hypothetical protein